MNTNAGLIFAFILGRLQNERLEWFSDKVKVHLRELSEKTTRFVENLDSARNRAAITQEELNFRYRFLCLFAATSRLKFKYLRHSIFLISDT